MKYIGIIREHHLGIKNYHLVEKCNSLTIDETNLILRFLKSNKTVFAVTMGIVSSFVTGEIIGPIYFLTDGFWIWPSYFNHYLNKGAINVEYDFLEYIISVGDRTKIIESNELYEIIQFHKNNLSA